jgi:sec-independent protein translocase protein TatA
MGPSIWQLLIVLVIILLLFGTKRLRNLGGDLGSAIKGFRSAVKDGDEGKKPPVSEQLEDTPGETIEGEVTSRDEVTSREKEKV